MIVNQNDPADSTSPVIFIKHNLSHKFTLRYSNLRIYPAEKRIIKVYCSFTHDTINILGKIMIKTQSNEYICEETQFFTTGGHECKKLRIDNPPKLWIEIKLKKCTKPICSVGQSPIESMLNKLSFHSNNFSLFENVFYRS